MPPGSNANPALKNHLLAALPAGEFNRINHHLKPVSFKLGKVLHESGTKMENVYFPTTAIISLLSLMENGATAEIGIVGNDGILGIELFMGGESTTNRAIIQSAGEAFKMETKLMKAEFTLGGAFQKMLLRYTQALIAQISQTAVCNRLHSIDQQFARWLLLSHDRLDSDKLVMTHDLISNMLGVRREGVTIAAVKLVKKHLIKNVRGTITVLDRQGLEDLVCECYEVVITEYNRLMSRGVARTFA